MGRDVDELTHGAEVAYGELVEGGSGSAGQITAANTTATQVGGRRRIDVDLKPLDGLVNLATSTFSSLRT